MEKLTNEFKIEFTKGDTYALAIKFKNITEDLRLAYFSVKENPDDSPLIQKSLGAGISKIDDRAYKNEKTYKVQLQSVDTINLEAKVQYLYDIQVTVGNVVKTVLHGVFVLGNTITGTRSATMQELEVAIDDELETEVSTTSATNGIEYETDPVALAKIGDLTKLDTNNKESVVKAINEVNNHANTNIEDINKIKNGTIELPSAKNVSGTINGKNISDIFEENGTTVKNSYMSQISQYASTDTSKGTIEERLTRLGFKQGTIILDSSLTINDGAVAENYLNRQGNYVLGRLRINANKITGATAGGVLGKVPNNFLPNENISFIAYYSFYGSTLIEVFINIDTSGNITIVSGSGWTGLALPPLDILIGYEAKPL